MQGHTTRLHLPSRWEPAPRHPRHLRSRRVRRRSLRGASLGAAAYARRFAAGKAQRRAVKGEHDNIITYGLEGEVDLARAPALLRWYRKPDIDEARWLSLSDAERLAHVGHSRGLGFVKIARAPAWLADTLKADPGGAELTTKPTDSLEEALARVATIDKHLGTERGRSKVYWQGNVAFQGRRGRFVRENRAGLTGYLKLAADYAAFGKLALGFARYERDPRAQPGKFLEHHSLPPLDSAWMKRLDAEVEAASLGMVNGDNHHRITGTYFRTWAYGDGRYGFETRDAHKDTDVLAREMQRQTHALQRGFGAYERFAKLTVLDRDTHLPMLGDKARRLLAKVSGGLHVGAFAHHYAIPMRPLEREYPALLGLGARAQRALSKRIVAARADYIKALEQIADGAHSRSSADNNLRVRVALARFVAHSGLYQAIDKHVATLARQR